ncbi:GntR family transcriptional regulator [uncultured Polaribacter sp.]|uniref:GntR family transcriptional regulator n=1 Tax=uncultured Polaribacter sp. TaxID=174711 RepID=UPI002631A6C4|nr:GntR family transcriptional regulator [uncultured Polaribacter sp.]
MEVIDNEKSKFNFVNNPYITKYNQIVNTINNAINTSVLKIGDPIPSVNSFSETYKVSRDTVFKAYSILKNNGIIKSVPNKGYFVSENRIKILLLMSTFKAYKEVLYHSILNNLPNNITIDLQFHHYNIKNFELMLNASNSEYYKFIVTGFDHPGVAKALSKIEESNLLLLDWNINVKSKSNYVFQNFGKSFYESLEDALHLFKKYEAIYFIYPEFTYHPKESLRYFEKFCKTYGFKNGIIKNSKQLMVQKGVAYISVSDRMLFEFLDQCSLLNLEPGKDVGILSYNETPSKKFINKGISVVTTDFKDLGAKAAEFIINNKSMQSYLPTKLILRGSL